MSNQRKQIRHALTELLNARTELVGMVEASRTYPTNAKNLPRVLIYTERDPGQKSDEVTDKRELQLKIVVIVQADSQADDALDDLCEAIEAQIAAHMDGSAKPAGSLATLADSVQYNDTVLTYQGEDGRADMVHAEMLYTFTYYRLPEVSVDDFAVVDIVFDMAGPRNEPQLPSQPDGQIDAAVEINLPQ